MRKSKEQVEKLQEQLIIIRASLGRWAKDGAVYSLREEPSPYQESKKYFVSEIRRRNALPINSYLTPDEMSALIRTLQQSGYKLTLPTHSELQQFFRNGKPITESDIFQDSMLQIESNVVDTRTGLEFLMDNWK